MKIQTTVTVYDTIEMDIKLPYYCQFEDKIFKVVSENKTIRVSHSETYNVITSAATWLFEKEIAKATAISPAKFTDAYLQALDGISKEPNLQEVAA
jgi:hypothetical protein